jgi:hypothetical protein
MPPAFNIALHHRHHRAVDDADDGERDKAASPLRQRREKWNGEAESRRFKHKARRRESPNPPSAFDMGVGQRCEMETANFDREGQRKGEQPHLLLGRQV